MNTKTVQMLDGQETVKEPYVCTHSMNKEKKEKLKEQYIKFDRKEVYALLYRNEKIIFYNLDFTGTTQLILMF